MWLLAHILFILLPLCFAESEHGQRCFEHYMKENESDPSIHIHLHEPTFSGDGMAQFGLETENLFRRLSKFNSS